MAILTLNEVRVSKLVGENGGFQVEEQTQVNGETWTKRYTVWSKTIPPLVDSYVNVVGTLSTKAREYTDNNGDVKTAVDVNVNDPAWQQVDNVGVPTALLGKELTDTNTPF